MWGSCALLVMVLAALVHGGSDVCFDPLGCFSMSRPWYSLFRPLPAPQPPDVIDTRFYLYTRDRPDRYDVITRPVISLTGSDYDGERRTFFITHGFTHDGNATWMSEMKDALLEKFDCNVILVDWGHGSSNVNYFLVASNIRVVAAEVVRLGKHLVEAEDSDVSNWHMVGHSLGAHAFSYVGKAIAGIHRLTALDPAQPGFEGYTKEVRLDASDADFVDVIHTNARPFIPLGGVGMVGTFGHVDYYMNGGLDQPGCMVPPVKLFSLSDLYKGRVGELMNYVACPHQRSYAYFTASIKYDNCTFWGRRLDDINANRLCGLDNCSPLGLDAIEFPGRGLFHITTASSDPFCFVDQDADRSMKQFRVKRIQRQRKMKTSLGRLLDKWRSDITSYVSAAPVLMRSIGNQSASWRLSWG